MWSIIVDNVPLFIALLVPVFFSFFTSTGWIGSFKKYFKRNNIIALDLHKKGKPRIPNSGGLPVSLSIMYGLLLFIGFQTFLFKTIDQEQLIYLLVSILSVILISIIGFLDDLDNADVIAGKRKKRAGVKQWLKPLATSIAAVPLMVVSAGETTMTLPVLGPINFGLAYPIILIPLTVVFISNAINLLGGFNGSEAGMGIVYCSFLGLYALLAGEIMAAAIFFSTLFALIGFLRFNWYPAQILPGDSLTYCLGAVVASGIIIGNMERAGVIIMIPFIFEFILKLISKFKASCLGKLRKDGKLDPPYGKKIYSWTHVIMNLGKLTEKQVTLILILIQIIFGLLIFL